MSTMSPFAQSLKIKVVKNVTRPVLQLSAEPTYLRIDSAIYEAEKQTVSRKRKNPDGTPVPINGKFATPPELMDVTDLVHNRPCQVVVNEVLGSQLNRTYPDNAYVHKCFSITKTMLAGRGYATFEIDEIEIEVKAPAPVEVEAPAPVEVAEVAAPGHKTKK
jgi:hypothetical protein